MQNQPVGNELLTSRARRRADPSFKVFVASRNEQRKGRRLIDQVGAVCKRLAKSGWHALLTHHGLNIKARDLEAELAKPLSRIDRSFPGFEDFAREGVRAIEPGKPANSLLFHALASPQVVVFPSNSGLASLKDFPSLAEIEAVEEYVYGAHPPSLEDLRAAARGAHLAVVVFSAEYRPAVGTVHGKHADMCFSRTGVSRVGTAEAEYLPHARGFLPSVIGSPHLLRVQPCRYAAYIAALVPGDKDGHGPMRFIEPKNIMSGSSGGHTKEAGPAEPFTALQGHKFGDASRNFWVPLHKLFEGDECLRGRTLSLRLSASHVNEKLRRAHLLFLAHGHNGGWCEPDISKPPFVLTEGIASFSENRDVDGSWLLVPAVHDRLVEPAERDGKPVTYIVPESKEGGPWRAYQSSLNLLPKPSGARAAPEYLHARHKIDDTGKEVDLNTVPEVIEVVRKGGYSARHYIDHTGDGWIDVECPELALDLPRRLPAYSIVATPDIFPAVKQTDLMQWTERSVPPSLLQTIWPESPGRPQPLSDQRYAANLDLGSANFDKNDDTITAIVGAFGSGTGQQTELNRERNLRASMLPDAAAGVFAPGWDVSYDRSSESDESDASLELQPGVTYLTNYGLGSPFVEDSKLCAALSSFWPAVAPDITRAVAPGRNYATATPLIDEVIGLGSSPPWDGIQGPHVDHDNKVVEYSTLAYADYVRTALDNAFHFDVIAQTSVDEYVARTFTMARVYEALGALTRQDKVKWALLSFRVANPADKDLQDAMIKTGRKLSREFTYRFEMIEHTGPRIHTNPAKFDKQLLDFQNIDLIFADPSVVLRREKDGTWTPRELRR